MTLPVNAISSALQQLHSMAAQATGGSTAATGASAAGESGAATAGGFASALKASLDKISGDQTKALIGGQPSYGYHAFMRYCGISAANRAARSLIENHMESMGHLPS